MEAVGVGVGAEPFCASQATMSAWPRGNAPTASCAWRQAWGVGKASTSGGCGGMAVYGRGAVGASARVASGADGPWACASKGDNRAIEMVDQRRRRIAAEKEETARRYHTQSDHEIFEQYLRQRAEELNVDPMLFGDPDPADGEAIDG